MPRSLAWKYRRWPSLVWMLALLVAACGPASTPDESVALPLAGDQPAFLWFFSDP